MINRKLARKIGNIRYLILMSVTNEKLFIFYDNNYKITGTYYQKNEFLTKDDFENIQIGITKLSEICEMDKNSFFYPFDADIKTGHIVKEGMIIISYSRIKDGEILEDPVVESIENYNNDEILEMQENNFFIKYIPYIMPIDKQ